MNDTTKNMRIAEQLAALADTLERQAAAPLDEAAAALHLAWQSDAAVQFLRRQQAVTDDLRARRPHIAPTGGGGIGCNTNS